jgi:hypothetical protein
MELVMIPASHIDLADMKMQCNYTASVASVAHGFNSQQEQEIFPLC